MKAEWNVEYLELSFVTNTKRVYRAEFSIRLNEIWNGKLSTAKYFERQEVNGGYRWLESVFNETIGDNELNSQLEQLHQEYIRRNDKSR